jgi:hypothetical protein
MKRSVIFVLLGVAIIVVTVAAMEMVRLPDAQQLVETRSR